MRRDLLALLGTAGLAWAGAPLHAAEDPTQFRQFHMDIQLAADGRAVTTVHFEMAATNDGAARAMAQQYTGFVDGLERVELVDGFTVKPDGRRIPVAEGAVRVQLAPGSPSLPAYSDLKRIIAVFPDVQAGDSIAFTWRRTVLQPVFPGHFSQSSTFSRALPWMDAQVRITAPLDLPLQTEAFGPELTVTEADGTRAYVWRYHAASVLADPSVLAPIDRAPRLFASTFSGWPAFGDAWAALVAPQAQPSPRIQALADEITQGAADRRAQTEAIYAWVSRHIRWVALYMGNGAWAPHPADQTLANGYGDCKDQVVLMLALLQAKGIAAEPALINLGNSYRLSGPATLSAFNHVIVFVPELDLFADTTARGAPFGTLPGPLYGKQVLHIRPHGSDLGRVPPLGPGVAVMRLRTEARLDADGRVSGTSVTEAEGPYATALRNLAENIQGSGAERAAAEQLRATGQPGGGSLSFGALDRVGGEYRVSGRFRLVAQPDWLKGDSFAVPTGLRLLPRPGDGPLGPATARNLPAAEPTPCFAAEQHESLSLALPPGRRPDRLPRDRLVEGETFTYRSHWSFQDGLLAVQRDLDSRIAQPLCQGRARTEAIRAMEEIRRDLDAKVALAED